MVLFGAAMVAGAIVGGGLSANGVEVPIISSLPRQLFLGVAGAALIGIGAWDTLSPILLPSPNIAEGNGSELPSERVARPTVPNVTSSRGVDDRTLLRAQTDLQAIPQETDLGEVFYDQESGLRLSYPSNWTQATFTPDAALLALATVQSQTESDLTVYISESLGDSAEERTAHLVVMFGAKTSASASRMVSGERMYCTFFTADPSDALGPSYPNGSASFVCSASMPGKDSLVVYVFSHPTGLGEPRSRMLEGLSIVLSTSFL